MFKRNISCTFTETVLQNMNDLQPLGVKVIVQGHQFFSNL
jgi:hypothetical protein